MQASDNVLLLQAKSDSDKLALHFFFSLYQWPHSQWLLTASGAESTHTVMHLGGNEQHWGCILN